MKTLVEQTSRAMSRIAKIQVEFDKFINDEVSLPSNLTWGTTQYNKFIETTLRKFPRKQEFVDHLNTLVTTNVVEDYQQKVDFLLSYVDGDKDAEKAIKEAHQKNSAKLNSLIRTNAVKIARDLCISLPSIDAIIAEEEANTADATA